MTNRQCWYLAHQVSGDVGANLNSALSWLAYLRGAEPAVTVIAPWLAAIASGEDDADPEARERGLVDCEVVVARCDGIILCGPRISSGMTRELAVAHRVARLDFATPPHELVNPIAFGIGVWERSAR